MKEEKLKRPRRGHCGECCWFKFEDIDGWGICPHQDKPIGTAMKCSDRCVTDDFVKEEEKRHYLAILIQHNRWRRDSEVPNSKKMVNPKELGEAIDFAVKYMKSL